MLLDRRSLASLLVILTVAGTSAGDEPTPGPAGRLAEAQRKHGLDPASSLELRVKDPAEVALEVANHFRRQEVSPRVARAGVATAGGTAARSWAQIVVRTGAEHRRLMAEAQQQASRPMLGPDPSAHRLTDAERAELATAVAALPPGFRRILMQRLRAFSFVDHMVVGGTVVVANPGEPEAFHDIAINANVFGRTASEWLTAKEQGAFVPGDSAVGVRIEVDGDLPALTYVLLHEAAHLVDGVERITEPPPPYPPTLRTAFLVPMRQFAPRYNPFRAGVWTDDSAVEPRHADPRRAAVEFYAAAGAVSADEIPALYAGLAATPFVSLYSTRNPAEDFAEFATVAHLTEALGRRYRAVLHVAGVEFLDFEPMRSDLVRSRLDVLRRFYDEPR